MSQITGQELVKRRRDEETKERNLNEMRHWKDPYKELQYNSEEDEQRDERIESQLEKEIPEPNDQEIVELGE